MNNVENFYEWNLVSVLFLYKKKLLIIKQLSWGFLFIYKVGKDRFNQRGLIEEQLVSVLLHTWACTRYKKKCVLRQRLLWKKSTVLFQIQIRLWIDLHCQCQDVHPPLYRTSSNFEDESFPRTISFKQEPLYFKKMLLFVEPLGTILLLLLA